MLKTKILFRNKKWIVQKADELNLYKQVASFKTELEAQNFRDQLYKDLEKALASVTNLTVVDAYKKYVDYKWELYDKHSQMTEGQAKIYLRHYNKWISKYFPKNLLLRKLTSLDLVNFFKVIRKEGLTFKSSRTLIYTFKGMFEWCVDRNLVNRSDYKIEFFELHKYPDLIPSDGSDKSKKTTMINRYEVNLLYKSIKPKDPNDYEQVVNFVGICIFIYTGARPAEVRAIEWKNVNFETSRIKIEQQFQEGVLTKRLKTEDAERVLYMAPPLKKILLRWKQYQESRLPNPRFVLHNANTDTAITDKQIRNFLWRHLANIGLAIIEDCHNHIKVISSKFKGEPFKTFRHFAATALLDAQASNPMLSDNFIKTQMGHSDIKTTRLIYGDHNDLDYQSNKDNVVAESLDKALNIKLN